MKPSIDPADRESLRGYEVLVCVAGGIAAYKVCELVSQLAQRGAGVTVALTESACRFVAPLTFQTLSGRPVLTSLWDCNTPYAAAHIGVTEAADLIVVAPATANLIGKMAGGIADDLVSTLLISADSPVLVVPGMNARMWAHPIVQDNVARLRDKLPCTFLGPAEGWLACRAVGPGRMVAAAEILDAAITALKARPPKRTQSD